MACLLLSQRSLSLGLSADTAVVSPPLSPSAVESRGGGQSEEGLGGPGVVQHRRNMAPTQRRFPTTTARGRIKTYVSTFQPSRWLLGLKIVKQELSLCCSKYGMSFPGNHRSGLMFPLIIVQMRTPSSRGIRNIFVAPPCRLSMKSDISALCTWAVVEVCPMFLICFFSMQRLGAEWALAYRDFMRKSAHECCSPCCLVACPLLSKAAVGGSEEERAMRKKKRKSKEDDRFNAVKSAIIKRLGDTCDVSPGIGHGVVMATRHASPVRTTPYTKLPIWGPSVSSWCVFLLSLVSSLTERKHTENTRWVVLCENLERSALLLLCHSSTTVAKDFPMTTSNTFH